jgi:hypothetical protein
VVTFVFKILTPYLYHLCPGSPNTL